MLGWALAELLEPLLADGVLPSSSTTAHFLRLLAPSATPPADEPPLPARGVRGDTFPAPPSLLACSLSDVAMVVLSAMPPSSEADARAALGVIGLAVLTQVTDHRMAADGRPIARVTAVGLLLSPLALSCARAGHPSCMSPLRPAPLRIRPLRARRRRRRGRPSRRRAARRARVRRRLRSAPYASRP